MDTIKSAFVYLSMANNELRISNLREKLSESVGFEFSFEIYHIPKLNIIKQPSSTNAAWHTVAYKEYSSSDAKHKRWVSNVVITMENFAEFLNIGVEAKSLKWYMIRTYH